MKAMRIYVRGGPEVLRFEEVERPSPHATELETMRLTDGQGGHAVFDSLGRATFEKSFNVLRTRGSMVVYGLSSGLIPAFKQTLLHEQSVKEVYNLSLALKESMIIGKKYILANK